MDQQQWDSQYSQQQQSSQDQQPKKKKKSVAKKRTTKDRTSSDGSVKKQKKRTHNKKCSGKLCMKKQVHTTASLGTGGRPADRCYNCSLLEDCEYFGKNTERYRELRKERLATGGGGKQPPAIRSSQATGGGVATQLQRQRSTIIQRDPIAISAKAPCRECGRMIRNSPDGKCQGCRLHWW